ncbi:MAG TPA: YIP1 family protein [Candidatus Dormibacteraeota bacterium]|nr:YIP1 family protein [Candidatus Dormibacteraeota bacterium]
MSTEPVVMSSEQPATISPMGRVIGVFFSPKSTFEDIVRKPDWILPTVLLIVLNIIICFALNQRMNWREYVLQQIEKSPSAAQMSAEQKQQRAEAGAKFAPISTYFFGTLAPLAVYLLTALVMWGAYYLLAGVSTTFGTAYSITVHAFLTGLVSTPLFVLILYLKPYGTIDLENPMATNLAVALPSDSAKWLVTLCKQFDIFAIWILILLAIGFAAVNPKKLKGGKSFTIAFGVFAAYVLVRTGIAFIFS